MTTLPFYEKVGYAMGDAAANLVWRGALAYLALAGEMLRRGDEAAPSEA